MCYSDPLGSSDVSQGNSAGGSKRHIVSTSLPLKASHSISLPRPAMFGRRLGSNMNESKLYSTDEIRFYNRDEPYYEFTNFYPCSVVIDKMKWPSSEHYFQAQKFIGTPYVEKIRNLRTAREAFQLSRDPKVSKWRRADWEQAKDDIMLKALRCKFTQEHLARELLKTGEKKLIEHTFNDSYWGDGGDGTGQNKLGKLLMQIRQELQASGKYGDLVIKIPSRSGLRRSASLSTLHRVSPSHSSVTGSTTTASRDDLHALNHTQVSDRLEARGRSSSLSTLPATKDQYRRDPSYSHHQSSIVLGNSSRESLRRSSKPNPIPMPLPYVRKPMPGHTGGDNGSKGYRSPSFDLYSHKDPTVCKHQSPSTSSKLLADRALYRSFDIRRSVSSSTHTQDKKPPPSDHRQHANQSSVQYNIISGEQK